MALDGSIAGLVIGHTCGLILPIKAGIGVSRRKGNRRVLFSLSLVSAGSLTLTAGLGIWLRYWPLSIQIWPQ